MRVWKAVLIIVLSAGIAFAAGSAAGGKKLFNDPGLAGSTNARSCNTCHADGQGLENAGTKEYTTLMGMKATSLEDVVNICIAGPLNGRPLAINSQDMQDIVAYIKSLGK
jgi:cytochrome c